MGYEVEILALWCDGVKALMTNWILELKKEVVDLGTWVLVKTKDCKNVPQGALNGIQSLNSAN